jgi:hypothetical protein
MEMAVGFALLRHFASHPEPPDRSNLILTHDVDTAQGFEWARRIAQCEMDHGFRSSWNVVTSAYPIDHDTLAWLVERGFEIGVHGETHDNRLPFRSEAEMRRRFDWMRPFRERYGVAGFRSPSWCRTPLLFDVLSDHFAYDSSCLDVDENCPCGDGGVGTTQPFLIRPSLVEVPATLPFETPSLRGLEWSRATEFWWPKIRWSTDARANIVVNTHPDSHFSGNAEALEAYCGLLGRLGPLGLRNVLPRDAVADFRQAAATPARR